MRNTRTIWPVHPESLRAIAGLLSSGVPVGTTLGEVQGQVGPVDAEGTGPIFGWVLEDPCTGILGFSQNQEPDFSDTYNVLAETELLLIAVTLETVLGGSLGQPQGAHLGQVLPVSTGNGDSEMACGYAIDDLGCGIYSFRHVRVDPSKPLPPISELW